MPPKRLNDQGWIARFQAHHPHYKYKTPSWLVGSNRYFVAICPLHGDFDVPAGQHAMGYSKCPDCTGKVRVRQPRSKEEKALRTSVKQGQNAEKSTKTAQNTLLNALNSLNSTRKPPKA